MRGELNINGELFEVVVNSFEISTGTIPIVGISVVSNIDKFNDMILESIKEIELPIEGRIHCQKKNFKISKRGQK